MSKKVKVSIFLDPEKATDLAVRAAQAGTGKSEVVEALLSPAAGTVCPCCGSLL